jgi:hypothetical protein
MTQIQNITLANREINFEHVGIVKADDDGIFDVPNDAVAQEVVKAIRGFKIVKVVSEQVEEPVKTNTTAKPSPTPSVAKITTPSATTEKPVEVEPTTPEKK